MVAVGKHLGLMRQVRVAAVDQIDAGQAVRLGNLLRAQMLLYRHRIVSAALHRRIVADDHRLPPRHPADAGDHARTGDLAAIKVAGSEMAASETGRTWIEQTLDNLTREQLAVRSAERPEGRVSVSTGRYR